MTSSRMTAFGWGMNSKQLKVEGNEVLRCGNPDYGGVPGMFLGSQNTTFVNNEIANQNYYDGGYTVTGNLISDSSYGGLGLNYSNINLRITCHQCAGTLRNSSRLFCDGKRRG